MMALIAEAALRSLLLGGLVWLAMLAVRPRNPHLQKTVWLTVLLASVAMPVVLLSKVAPSIDAPEYLLSITGTSDSVASLKESAVSASPLFIRAATAAYAIVAIALIVRFAAGFFRLSRIRREAHPLTHASVAGLDVRVTTKLLCPATFGSTILLPEEMGQWSAEKLAAVLSHERAHVLNRDCYVLWLARLHACLFWFNPLAWWLSRRLADLAETTSDDAVIAALPDRTGYADMLLEIARKPTRELVVASAARGNISARIERIVSNVPPAAPPRRWVRAVAVAVLIPPFTMAASTLSRPAIEGSSAARSENTTTYSPDDPMRPQVLPWDGGNLEQYYPFEAKRMGKEGLATVEVDLDAQGNVLDARVAAMDPADEMWQFAPSALELARKTRFSNPAGKPARVRFKVKFDLK